MQSRHQPATRSLLSLCCLPFLLPLSLAAQTSPNSDTPTLTAVLQRLQANLSRYRSTIPSFFCDEHVISWTDQVMRPGPHTSTDSIFRLRRTLSKTQPRVPVLVESREIKKVDNRPSSSQYVHGPAVFEGAFSNALSVVTLSKQRCYDYRLLPEQLLHHVPVLVVGYQLKPSVISDPSCPGPEMHSGKAFIDSSTLQIVRMEMDTPDHVFYRAFHGDWTWSIDYVPVTFDDEQFLLPATIRSNAENGDHSESWTFIATYLNYHKEDVSIRIIPNGDTAPQ
jgi:hypothetical protein